MNTKKIFTSIKNYQNKQKIERKIYLDAYLKNPAFQEKEYTAKEKKAIAYWLAVSVIISIILLIITYQLTSL